MNSLLLHWAFKISKPYQVDLIVSKINDISFKAVCGENGAVDIQATDEWKRHLKEII